MALICLLVPPTRLARFLAVAFDLPMSAGCASAQGRHTATYRLTPLIVRSFLGRSRCRWILESFEGMEHADDEITATCEPDHIIWDVALDGVWAWSGEVQSYSLVVPQ